MAPPRSLELLPLEILLNIVADLHAHDLTQLSRCSKFFASLVEPLLWTDVELHAKGFHESPLELNDPPPARSPSSRPYLHASNPARVRNTNISVFFIILMRLYHQDIDRLKRIASRVKHLCVDTPPEWRPKKEDNGVPDPDALQIWRLFPFFCNLESLELHAEYPYSAMWEETVDEITEPPLPRLRFAKLSRYIPRAVAAWVLRSGPTLERLELSMLDRPISTCLTPDPQFKPLPEENLLDQEDPNGPEYASLHGEFVTPRPLGDFLPSSKRLKNPSALSLPKLKHLYLCQPTYSSSHITSDYYSWSSRAETSCLEAWREILQASSAALQTLVLEQRPAGEWNEMDGISSRDWMIECVDMHAGDGLIDMVLAEMTKSGLKQLKHVYLYGIKCYENEPVSGAEQATSAGSLLQSLKAVGVQGEARLGMWCAFDHNDGMTRFGEYYDGKDDDDDDYYLDPEERTAEEIQEWIDGKQQRLWDRVIARV